MNYIRIHEIFAFISIILAVCNILIWTLPLSAAWIAYGIIVQVLYAYLTIIEYRKYKSKNRKDQK